MDSTYVPQLSVESALAHEPPRHSAIVRVTHWISAVSFLVLLLSGVAILLAHPRLYWGETGHLGTPSLMDLPLPFVLDIPIRGPGRYLHFLSAWVFVFTGLVYVISGVATRHFIRNFRPKREEMSVRAIVTVMGNHLRFVRPGDADFSAYNVLQRVTYATVIFVLVPVMIWTGLAMSPAVTSVFPWLATLPGGQQSARTIHFFVTLALLAFLLIHIAMVCQSGFKRRMRAMITGRDIRKKDLT